MSPLRRYMLYKDTNKRRSGENFRWISLEKSRKQRKTQCEVEKNRLFTWYITKKKCNFAVETQEVFAQCGDFFLTFTLKMSTPSEQWKGQGDSDILFSRVVKAGKRVYYIDVKSDRRGEYYLSMTESKRVKDGTETERPVFEKHKIFLYREDMLKFFEAFSDAVHFVGDHTSLASRHNDAAPAQDGTATSTSESTEGISTNFDIEF